MSNDFSELLFPRRAKHHKLVTAEFNEACQVLQNKYGAVIHNMHVKFGTGDTVAYLRNVLEGEGIHSIVVCPDIKLGKPSDRSVPMLPLLKKTGFPIDQVPIGKSEARHADLKVLHMSMAAH
jgi:hypothetical protein